MADENIAAEQQQNAENNSVMKLVGEKFKKYIVPELKQTVLGPMDVLRSFAKAPRSVFNFGRPDFVYLSVVLALLAFGLVVHYSASGNDLMQFEQVKYALIGIIAMLLVSCVRVSVYKKMSSFFMAVALFLMIAVLFALVYNGTRRWIWHMQPSELGKVALIMFFAYLIDKYRKKNHQTSTFFAFLALTVFFAILIFLEVHLSGTVLFLCIGYAMMWYGDMSKKWFLGVTALVVFAALLLVIKPEMFSPVLKDYQIQRIVIWKKILFNSELTAKERIGDARQVLQSIYGIGSGGAFGKGYGNSGQKINNLSEKTNDFIFAVLGEEWGFIGGLFMLALFGLLIVLGIRIAVQSSSYYGTLLALGISTQMAIQVLINVAVATSLLPNTGISLPFFSEGGSSLIVTLASMGLMLGVSKKDKNAKGEKNA